ncbi:rhomboid family intramembrane serine protease [Goodfellowiella coeruleoviolacea]|uniref:rhomboid family intramembrane serine protease n=1 Tax=Goodfellowiella coeruleoviolacea TaxID=334858 RepID=UPI003898F029
MLPPRPLQAAVAMVAFTALLYVIEVVDAVGFHGQLDQYGVQPRSVPGLLGVVFSPLLHANYAHLASNTLPVLLFGFLAMAGGLAQWIAVTLTIWVVSGLGVWLTADAGSVTVGASGLAFGWLAFLLVRGLFNRSFKQIAVAAVLFFYWGSLLWGLLPGNPAISWQGHLFGALAGVLAAWLAARAGASTRTPTGTPRLPGRTTA